MTGEKTEAARIERMFFVPLVGVAIFMVVSFYVRVTTDTDPFWTELATPLFFALLGARSIALPAPPEQRKGARFLGFLLIACAALIFLLNIFDS
jgi:peptidoglycan/LPS O-acetylase OafA/YrhL